MEQDIGKGILAVMKPLMPLLNQLSALFTCCFLNRAPMDSMRYLQGRWTPRNLCFTLFQPR